MDSANEPRKLNINQWAAEDRPREKLIERGADALSDAELLAILIGSGTTRETAVELMKRVLRSCQNNLNALGKLSLQELTSFKGIGEAKAVTIMAACELGKRRAAADALERKDLGSASSIYGFMRQKMQDLDVEEFWVLLMNQRYKLIKALPISHGGLTETAVDVRVIMREAVLCNATTMAVCHNHPSNNASPSRQDDALTDKIKKACDTMRIYLVDHVIVCDGTYYSYAEQGKL